MPSFHPGITIGISVVSTGFAFSRYIGSFHGPSAAGGLHSPNSASLFPTVIAVSLLPDIGCTSRRGLQAPSLRREDSRRKTPRAFHPSFPLSSSSLAIIGPRRSEAEENPPATRDGGRSKMHRVYWLARETSGSSEVEIPLKNPTLFASFSFIFRAYPFSSNLFCKKKKKKRKIKLQ